jgi:hypothetical protein
MATAYIQLTDPALTVEMKINAPDGLLPALAQWIIDTSQRDPVTGADLGYKTETIMVDVVTGKDADGVDIVEQRATTVRNPLPLGEVYNKLFGQMYYGWVGKMVKEQAAVKAKAAADAIIAKAAVPDFSKI